MFTPFFPFLRLKLIENLSTYNEQKMSEATDMELAFNLLKGTIIQLTRALMKMEGTLFRD